ncbi:hypothetical protein [Agarivorans sp. JK6]|uniref:hypothetical protein n=1 Tax=Agarivorans sp. JK6 TaxID=2997426 RepID=UPI0038737CEB
MRNTLDRHLIPEFGNVLVSDISLSQLDYFRNRLTQQKARGGRSTLTRKRINHIIWPLVAIISLAAEEYQFDYPFRRYKAFKEEPAESSITAHP